VRKSRRSTPPRTRSRTTTAPIAWLLVLVGIAAGAAAGPIDRRALVTRNNPKVTAVDPWAPLTVGNGHFAFTVDVTGLQTFGESYHSRGIPLETLARWAWHTELNPSGFRLEDANVPYTAYGRAVDYPTDTASEAARWLRRNPHDVPLGTLGLTLTGSGGEELRPADVRGVSQVLDLWSGVVTSRYTIEEEPVVVTTAAHPRLDAVAVRIESALVSGGRLGVRLAFPRGHDLTRKNTPALDWGQPESHETRTRHLGDTQVRLHRRIDATHYEVGLAWGPGADWSQAAPHSFRVLPTADTPALEIVLAFSPSPLPEGLPSVDETLSASAESWRDFWASGAAVDLSGSRDPRAAELERRVVLSQYLTAVQMAGDVPPQETGLTCSSWYGKHHTEMIWWHVAHFALWGREAFVEKALEWYQGTLPVARRIAASRGLKGARWPKMVGPRGRESPGGNPLIAWNQPHPIALAELLYRADPSPKTLERYRDLVQETAEGLVSMLHWVEAEQRYVLGPPLWISQEIHDPRTSANPSFELSYWGHALGLAQTWRERLGRERSAEWSHVLEHLSELPRKDGRYVAMEAVPDTFDNPESRRDHPTMVAPLGWLPGVGADPATMRRTLDAVVTTWDWEGKIWGWDYAMLAMTAARLGDRELAVDLLLKDGPHNHYAPNGHCPQPGAELAVYLPANGALLAAVAMMAGGWDGAAPGPAPGFPDDGSWTVVSEGLRPLP
jgi:hypothetical protein